MLILPSALPNVGGSISCTKHSATVMRVFWQGRCTKPCNPLAEPFNPTKATRPTRIHGRKEHLERNSYYFSSMFDIINTNFISSKIIFDEMVVAIRSEKGPTFIRLQKQETLVPHRILDSKIMISCSAFITHCIL